MPPTDRKRGNHEDEECKKFTSSDLQTILEVNYKTTKIHLEVEAQNEKILEELKHCKTKIDKIDENLFKLVLIFGSTGIGTILAIIKLFLEHK